MSELYIKPIHKIVLRFLSELIKYVKTGRPIIEPIKGFPAYFRYNRKMVFRMKQNFPGSIILLLSDLKL
jgi:hypothetical protein